MSQPLKLTCAICKTTFEIKQPLVVKSATTFHSQMTLIMREVARCPSCSTTYIPELSDDINKWTRIPDIEAEEDSNQSSNSNSDSDSDSDLILKPSDINALKSISKFRKH